MSDLPLFPLHTVLFPHTPIQLHIFEDRYLRMIGMCLQEQQPFGVVLIRRGAEALGPLAEPYLVGCTAEIVSSELLGGGRLNIVALGIERFRIRSLDTHTHPYLSGRVEPYPWLMLAPQQLPEHADNLRARLRRYLERLGKAGGGEATLDPRKLPDGPLELACLAAAVLDIDPAQKQGLLESESLDGFIDDLQYIYRREAALINALLAHGDRDGMDFSLN
jgi:uncharacterized protein